MILRMRSNFNLPVLESAILAEIKVSKTATNATLLEPIKIPAHETLLSGSQGAVM